MGVIKISKYNQIYVIGIISFLLPLVYKLFSISLSILEYHSAICLCVSMAFFAFSFEYFSKRKFPKIPLPIELLVVILLLRFTWSSYLYLNPYLLTITSVYLFIFKNSKQKLIPNVRVHNIFYHKF